MLMVLQVLLAVHLAMQAQRIWQSSVGPRFPNGKAIIVTDPTSGGPNPDPALVYYSLTGTLLGKVTNPNLAVVMLFLTV